jgi:prepilin-type N-terminal cleavage/methylation domain-containing protein
MSRSRKSQGFSLAEMLLALTIIAMLMASIATAFHAASRSYDANSQVSRATHTARSVLTRMMREVRTCSTLTSVSTSEYTQLTITPAVDGSGLTKIVYVLQGNTLHCIRTVSGVDQDITVIGGEQGVSVQSMTFVRETDAVDPSKVLGLTATLGISVDGHVLDVTSTAALRKNQL